jgi:DNA-3-methyladenine glycosylase II
MATQNYQQLAATATKELQANDPILARVIEGSGAVGIEPHHDYFRALSGSVIGQQLSVKAAATIRNRFAELGSSDYPTPQETLDFADETLRGVGLSGAKVKYVQDLAAHVLDGRLDLAHLAELPNEEIITAVTDVKGVGEWTAHMFLIFCVGRLDVLPTGDLGIRKGMQNLYELPELPDPLTMIKIAERNHWTGYESIASWYIWRSLDLDVVI